MKCSCGKLDYGSSLYIRMARAIDLAILWLDPIYGEEYRSRKAMVNVMFSCCSWRCYRERICFIRIDFGSIFFLISNGIQISDNVGGYCSHDLFISSDITTFFGFTITIG
jgi:hypothetical protein